MSNDSNNTAAATDGEGRGAGARRSRGLPADHAQRVALNDEVHARPPQPLVAPLRVSYLALLSPWAQRSREYEQVAALARRYGIGPPERDANHYVADFGTFRLKWERHSEFSRYKFIAQGADPADPFGAPAIDVAPREWIAGLPGEVITAFHVALLPGVEASTDYDGLSQRFFDGNVLIGSDVGGGAATALTDLRIRADGCTRLLLARGSTRAIEGRAARGFG